MNNTTLLAATLALLAGGTQSLAQRGAMPMPVQMPDRITWGQDEERGVMDTSGGEHEAPQVKTPLGMLITQQDFTRIPETVLQARTALQIQAREARLKPPAPADTKPEPVRPAEPNPAEGAPTTTPPDGAPPAPAEAEGAEPKDPNARPPTPEEIKLAEHFRLMVVAGDWAGVGEFLKTKLAEDAPGVYSTLLMRLGNDQAMVPDEIVRVADASPVDLRDDDIDAIARLLQSTVARGADPSHLALTIKAGTKFFGGKEAAGRTRAARLLMGAGLPVEAQPYLDPLDGALKEHNARLINLHAMYFDGLASREKSAMEQTRAMRRAWELCLEVLKIGNAPTAERASAAARAVSYLDRVGEEESRAFLASMFKSEPDVAWSLVNNATMRARAARMQFQPPEARITGLVLLKRIGEALISGAPERLDEYRTALNMMAMTILEEAEDTKNQRADERFRFIPPERLGDALPGNAWLLAGDPGLASKLEVMSAGVSGGAGDFEGVIAMIRPLAKSDPARATRLATSLLGSWSAPRQPQYNEYGYGRSYYNRGYYGGYNQQSIDGAIPLTRARQQRQLETLAGVLTELRKAAVDVPAPILGGAFTASHSQAEVFREADVARCFGPVASLDPELAMSLAETMRRNLGTQWRRPEVQQAEQTRRNDEQIGAEVERGYELASRLASRGAAAASDAWRSALMRADLAFDRSEFLYGRQADLATCAALREEAFKGYSGAAAAYTDELSRGSVQPSARVYFQWMSSALGASDLGYLTRQDKPSEEQVDAVIGALARLPESSREAHAALFAKSVEEAMMSLSPELKVRFLTHACRVIGESPSGAAARKLLSYYNDLRTEVELHLEVDGPGTVGAARPFGANLSVRATGEVARETGGFSKYTLNQQYNPTNGQPINYRDDLEKKIRETLAERFDVLAVTFHKPGVPPVGAGREGWEDHPLAYITLKAKDASVDRIPALQMDLDFTDGMSVVIMPKTTSPVLIDCRAEPAAVPPEELEITQTLDDRDGAKGVLKLEITAKGKGLVPSLEELFGPMPVGFVVSSKTDNGAQVLDLDTTTARTRPVTERSWAIEFTAAAGPAPTEFTFPAPKITAKSASLKRYADADIVDTAQTVPVTLTAPRPARWPMMLAGAGVLLTAGALALLVRKTKRPGDAPPTFVMPAELTPVGAVTLLRRIGATGLAENERRDIGAAVAGIERRYFAPGAQETGVDTELRVEVQRWVDLAESRARRTAR